MWKHRTEDHCLPKMARYMTLFYISLEHPKPLAYTQVDLCLLCSSRRVHTLLLRCLGELSLMMSGAACGSSSQAGAGRVCNVTPKQTRAASVHSWGQHQAARAGTTAQCLTWANITRLEQHSTKEEKSQRKQSIWHYYKHHCGIKVTFSNNPVNSS